MDTEYELVPSPSAPPAICWGEVESGREPLQAPVPPPPETIAVLQLTLIAETGMVGQLTKAVDPACTLSVQFCKCEPLSTIQVKLPCEEPDTVPRSGLVA